MARALQRPPRLSPNLFLHRIERGDDPQKVLKEYGQGTATVSVWCRRDYDFKRRYNKAMAKRGPAPVLTPVDFDALYPNWKSIFIALLCEKAETGERPTFSGAVAEMGQRGIPLTISRVYSAKTPGTKLYDEAFATECETYGSAEYVNSLIEEFERQLMAQVSQGKDLKTALAYLKSQRLSPLKERQELRVSRREEKIQTRRLEIRASIHDDSMRLGERVVKEVTGGVSKQLGEGASERGGPPDFGRGQGGRQDRVEAKEEEEVVEEEVVDVL